VLSFWKIPKNLAQWLVAIALLAVIAIAGWLALGTVKSPNLSEPVVDRPLEFHYKCTSCKQDWSLVGKDEIFKMFHGNLPNASVAVDCPLCGAKASSLRTTRCPNCGKYYVSQFVLDRVMHKTGDENKPRPTSEICPYCGTDVMNWRPAGSK